MRNIPENSVQCEKCGERFVQNYSNQKLCDACGSYSKQDIKQVTCQCGKVFEVDARNMTKTKCDKCQSQISKEKTRLRVQKFRNKSIV